MEHLIAILEDRIVAEAADTDELVDELLGSGYGERLCAGEVFVYAHQGTLRVQIEVG